jgi:flagellar hook-associated protein 2
VVGYLQNSSGFGQKLQTALDQIGSQNGSGAISLAIEANGNQEATLNANVSSQETLIAAQKTTLTNQLNLANEILQSIPQQLDEINQLYSAITGYNTKM